MSPETVQYRLTHQERNDPLHCVEDEAAAVP